MAQLEKRQNQNCNSSVQQDWKCLFTPMLPAGHVYAEEHYVQCSDMLNEMLSNAKYNADPCWLMLSNAEQPERVRD